MKMKLLIVQLAILLALNGCLAKKGGGCGRKTLCERVAALEEEIASLEDRVEALEEIATYLPKSCQELYDDGKRVDGVYKIDAGAGEDTVYCVLSDNEGCGGGFTLVMKLDGTKDTFKWDSPLWTNNETLNAEAGLDGLDKQETKQATYWTTPFTKVCVGMDDAGHRSFKSIDVSADSLHALIAGGQYHQTSLGRDAWKDLLADGSLQENCNREGFNAQASFKIRIGIISNNEEDCDSSDSYIGFGSSGDPSTGNSANEWNPDNGVRDTETFGYILVQ